jgi:hypothetical protein
VNGQFTLANVPAGPLGITARRLGFAAKTVTGIQVVSGRTAEQNISLTASTVQLEAVTVSATTERGSVSDALDAQRSSSGVVNSVTAEPHAGCGHPQNKKSATRAPFFPDEETTA